MSDRILFVDDEIAVLDGYKRLLSREFAVDTAVGGMEGLASIRNQAQYSVIISDMRMPGMSGAQFLSQVRTSVPQTTRMLLTGYTDQRAAIEAVNEGNIFRFLTKPCDKDNLVKAISAGVKQHQLIKAETELLEKTLLGSIKVFADVLGAVNPETFGRSMRITRLVRHLAAKSKRPCPWYFEAAATLSQLGCVTLDADLLQKVNVGIKLSTDEKRRFDGHPQVAMTFLTKIPRLESVAWMIGQQLTPGTLAISSELPADTAEEISFGAQILRLAVAFDELKLRALTDEEALNRLRGRRNEFGLELIEALVGIKPQDTKMILRKVSSSRLAIGMILDQEIRNQLGMLVVPKGQEITHALMARLDNFSRAGLIDKEILAFVAVQH